MLRGDELLCSACCVGLVPPAEFAHVLVCNCLMHICAVFISTAEA
jgi:hypothetical protein